jgi:hypothetical protein
MGGAEGLEEMCPRGWMKGANPEFEAIHAIVAVTAMLRGLGPGWKERLRRVSATLVHGTVVSGWLPETSNDPVLVDAIRRSRAPGADA